MSTDTVPTRDVQPISWADLQAAVTGISEGLFLATTGRDGRPHVAFVMPGWGDERLWISIFARSQKATNMRERRDVAMTCAPTPEINLLLRATARLVEDRDETAELWNRGVLPYDPAMFFTGPDDPEALFVELLPTSGSIHPLGPGPTRRWRPA